MIKYFPRSIQLINSNIILVFLLSTTSIYLNSYMLFLSTIASFIFSVIIYGRFSESIMNLERRSYIEILKEHWINYLIVIVIIGLPTFLFIMLSTALSHEPFYMNDGSLLPKILTFSFKIILVLSIDILTIYVIPLVFLTRKTIPIFLLGIKCLLKYFKYSLPLVGLVICINAIRLPGNMLISYIHLNSTFAIVLTGFIHNLVVSYLGFIVFNTACFALINDHFVIE